MSSAKFVSFATRLLPDERKATKRPSALIDGLWPVAGVPSSAALISSVVPVLRSNTNTSELPLVSAGWLGRSKLLAIDANATKRPSALTDGAPIRFRKPLSPLLSLPLNVMLSRSVVRFSRSRTKMSKALFVSPGTRLSAFDENATKRPSALIEATSLSLSPWTPLLLRLISSRFGPDDCAYGAAAVMAATIESARVRCVVRIKLLLGELLPQNAARA